MKSKPRYSAYPSSRNQTCHWPAQSIPWVGGGQENWFCLGGWPFLLPLFSPKLYHVPASHSNEMHLDARMFRPTYIVNNALDFRQGSIITRCWHIAKGGWMADKMLITGTALYKLKETAFPDSSHCSFALTLLRMIVSALNRNERETCWQKKLVSLLKSVLIWIREEHVGVTVNWKLYHWCLRVRVWY